MNLLQKIIITSLISLVTVSGVTSCSHVLSSDMPSGSVSMQETYDQAINGTEDSAGNNSLDDIRQQVAPQDSIPINYAAYTRTPWNAIDSQFQPVPNPTIVMYIYPHMSADGTNQLPVPGYSTVFPLYDQTYYS